MSKKKQLYVELKQVRTQNIEKLQGKNFNSRRLAEKQAWESLAKEPHSISKTDNERED